MATRQPSSQPPTWTERQGWPEPPEPQPVRLLRQGSLGPRVHPGKMVESDPQDGPTLSFRCYAARCRRHIDKRAVLAWRAIDETHGVGYTTCPSCGALQGVSFKVDKGVIPMVNFGYQVEGTAPDRRSPEDNMAYDPSRYEERQAANDRSRQFATNDGQPWSPVDDAVVLQEWVFRGSEHRNEGQVAKDLRRTIEAVRNRAHFLRGVHTGVRYNKSRQDVTPRTVCTGCWLEVPVSGTCGTCD